ncbi:hypothetical protein J7K70_01730, partial [bacterium]|nr:hypothetical protein [bacterium]
MHKYKRYKIFFLAIFLVLLSSLFFFSFLEKESVIQITSGYSLEQRAFSPYTYQDINNILEEYKLFHSFSCQPDISS